MQRACQDSANPAAGLWAQGYQLLVKRAPPVLDSELLYVCGISSGASPLGTATSNATSVLVARPAGQALSRFSGMTYQPEGSGQQADARGADTRKRCAGYATKAQQTAIEHQADDIREAITVTVQPRTQLL